jgi:hypothetical protein
LIPSFLALLSWLSAVLDWDSLGVVVTVAGIALGLSLTWVIHQGIQLARLEKNLSCCHP